MSGDATKSGLYYGLMGRHLSQNSRSPDYPFSQRLAKSFDRVTPAGYVHVTVPNCGKEIVLNGFAKVVINRTSDAGEENGSWKV